MSRNSIWEFAPRSPPKDTSVGREKRGGDEIEVGGRRSEFGVVKE